MRRLLMATIFPTVLLTVTLGIFGPGLARAAPTKTPATRFSIAMTLIERSGETFADRNVDAELGIKATTTVQRKTRTVTVDAIVTPGDKLGCYKIALVVRDKKIDATGAFNKTEWKSATEPCDTQPITLGPKEEIQLRIAVKPAN